MEEQPVPGKSSMSSLGKSNSQLTAEHILGGITAVLLHMVKLKAMVIPPLLMMSYIVLTEMQDKACRLQLSKIKTFP